jgi:hypothetical protein
MESFKLKKLNDEHTAEPLVLEPISFEVEIAVEKLEVQEIVRY